MLNNQLLQDKITPEEQEEIKKLSVQNHDSESSAIPLEILEDEVLDYVFGNNQFYLDNGES